MNRKPNKKTNKVAMFLTMLAVPFVYAVWLLSQDYACKDDSVFDA